MIQRIIDVRSIALKTGMKLKNTVVIIGKNQWICQIQKKITFKLQDSL